MYIPKTKQYLLHVRWPFLAFFLIYLPQRMNQISVTVSIRTGPYIVQNKKIIIRNTRFDIKRFSTTSLEPSTILWNRLAVKVDLSPWAFFLLATFEDTTVIVCSVNYYGPQILFFDFTRLNVSMSFIQIEFQTRVPSVFVFLCSRTLVCCSHILRRSMINVSNVCRSSITPVTAINEIA